MPQKAHFISGLLLSGSTLLAAILRKNPRFHAAMTSPVGGLVERMWEAMSEDNEFSAFISPEQKRARILSIFSFQLITTRKLTKKSSSTPIAFGAANCH